jgi:hypothetical protein
VFTESDIHVYVHLTVIYQPYQFHAAVNWPVLLWLFQEIHLRVPIHKIAAVCYIRDDEQHLLCVKFGDLSLSVDNLDRTSNSTDMCQLAVLSCDSRVSTTHMLNQ